MEQTKLVIVFPTAESRDAALAHIELEAEQKVSFVRDHKTTRKLFEKTVRNHMATGCTTVYCVGYDGDYCLLDSSELLDFVWELCVAHKGGYQCVIVGRNNVYEDKFDALSPEVMMDNITLFDWEIKVTNYY